MRPPRSLLLVLIVVLGALAGCSDGDSTNAAGPDPTDTDLTADRCLVRLHGRSGTGAEPVVHPDHVELLPTGNDQVDGGYQWLYDNDDHHRAAQERVEAWIDQVGCTDVVVYGFSNGAAFAGALYCRGVTFDDRLRGVVIDDPVTDEAVVGCEPHHGVPVALYWTGGLTEDQPNARCAEIGFTCSGDVLLGIDAYAAALDVPAQTSPHDTHTAFEEAPELLEWLLDEPA